MQRIILIFLLGLSFSQLPKHQSSAAVVFIKLVISGERDLDQFLTIFSKPYDVLIIPQKKGQQYYFFSKSENFEIAILSFYSPKAKISAKERTFVSLFNVLQISAGS